MMPNDSPKAPIFWKNFIFDPHNFFGTCPEHVQKVTNKFIKNMNHLAEKILWWDQDVLNYTFDGKYTELSKFLNSNFSGFMSDNT